MRYLKLGLILLATYLTAFLVTTPMVTMEAVERAMHLCAEVVIPSLFPFFVCSRLLIGLGVGQFCSRMLSKGMRPLFGVPGSGALAVVLGVFSGYPIGAATVVGLYEQGSCTKQEGERLLTFCNNAGPLFVMGSVGAGMLHSRQLGVMLYLIHLVSALLTGILFRNYGTNDNVTMSLPPGERATSNPASVVADAVADGVDNIFKVCGFVVFFSVLCASIPWKSPFLYGMLEMTGGLKALIDQTEGVGGILPVISFFLALSGLSILLQTVGIVHPSGLSVKPYLLGKLVQAVLSFFLTWVVCKFFPVSQTAFAGSVPAPVMPTVTQFLAFTLLEFLIALGVVLLLCFAGMISEKLWQKK